MKNTKSNDEDTIDVYYLPKIDVPSYFLTNYLEDPKKTMSELQAQIAKGGHAGEMRKEQIKVLKSISTYLKEIAISNDEIYQLFYSSKTNDYIPLKSSEGSRIIFGHQKVPT